MTVRILMIGDIVGKPGRELVRLAVPALRAARGLDFVVANAENVAGGSGMTPANYQELTAAGVDCITLGDHAYRRKEIFATLDREKNLLKPANFPADSPGRGWTVLPAADGTPVAVICLLGRVFMRPVDCPWAAVDRILEQIPPEVKTILVDMHAEATSDEQIMGRYLDGRVSAVLGTHTHVATADEQILPGGTAFQCDVGMTGPMESILGRRIDRVIETTLSFRPTPFDVAGTDIRLHGTVVEIDPATGRARSIERLVITQDEAIRLAKEYPEEYQNSNENGSNG